MIVNGFIKSQDLKISAPLIVSDTFNFLEFRFYFQTKEWDGLTKWAHFKQGNLSYEIPLQEDEIPASEEFSLPPGPWKVYIHGSKYTDGDITQRITTDEATFMVQRSGCGCGGPLPIVPISVGERLEARIEKLEKGGSIFQSEILTSAADQNDEIIIGTLVAGAELRAGDIAIIKRYINGASGKVSYTSYVYDPENGWIAISDDYKVIASIKDHSISTDKLVQGTEVLIINGGKANTDTTV